MSRRTQPTPKPLAASGKRLASAASTGSPGVTYEHRVQAVYVLAMLSGGATPLGRYDRVVELRFQAGVHKYKTDDLVCTLRDDTAASRPSDEDYFLLMSRGPQSSKEIETVRRHLPSSVR